MRRFASSILIIQVMKKTRIK